MVRSGSSPVLSISLLIKISRTLYLELDVPLTGISALQDRVGIPSFNTPFCEADHRGNQSSHFEAHYASQIALRRLCANMHNNIYECKLDVPVNIEHYLGVTY
jgi:hypothetical protein